MHIFFVADESILPSDHGGRLAMANDVRALTAAGFTVSLIVSVDEPQREDMFGHYSYEFVCPVHFTAQRPVDVATRTHPDVPQATAIRLPDDVGLRSLRTFLDTQPIPSAVVATRETSLLLGGWIAASSRVPLLLRSHNDEIDYWRGAASDSSSPSEARRLRSEADLLSGAFRRLLRPVRAVALISPDDAVRYRRVRKRTAVVPALVAETTEPAVPFESRLPQALFIGSLTMPHTTAGIQWFTEEVWPLIHDSLPSAEFAIAGQGAPPHLLEAVERADGVSYLGRVENVQLVLDQARVFVNPVFTGSGVNMKLAQPAANGVPIVATVFGMRGAPALAAKVEPSDHPNTLARQTLSYLQDPVAWSGASDALREVMSSVYSRVASSHAWNDFIVDSLRDRRRGGLFDRLARHGR